MRRLADRIADRLGLRALGGTSLYPLVVLFGLNAVDELDQAAFAVLIPNIRDHFGLDLEGITTLLAIIVPINIFIGLPLAFYADRWRRTRMAAAGATAWGAFSVLTGLAPNLWALGIGRVGAGLGRSVNAPTHESLLADYYPPRARPGAYATHRIANSVGQMVGPLLAGVLAYTLGWRSPFVLLAVPTFVFVLLALRLREPVRGVHERRAQGADEELANLEEEFPSWDESWRIVMSVRTLRRIWWSFPFLIGGVISLASLRNLFYEDVFGLNEVQRGALEALSEPFQIAGLLVAIPLVTRMLETQPARVFRLFAYAATAAAVGFVGFAAAPNVWVAAAFSFSIAFAVASLLPGLTAIGSLIVPARARSFGLSLGRLFALPGLIVALVTVGRIGDTFGLRWGLAAMIPIFLTGAYILASAGGQLATDIRSAQMAALAAAEFRRGRSRGDAKLLVCRGIDVHYGQVQVVFGVDFDVADGEIVALLGTNGAGKSTLLRAIAGTVNPSGGAIVFDGVDITRLSPQESLRRGVVYMPGGRSVFPTLTVADNLHASGWLSRRAPSDLAGAIDGALARFPRLRERYDQPAGNLSGGEQQMLGISMAFIASPRLLMIDELSLGLAPTVVEHLLDTVREIHEGGATIVLVEQSVNIALTIAHRAVFLEKGEVRFEGPTSDLLDRPDVLRSVFVEGASRTLGNAPNGRRRSGRTDSGPQSSRSKIALSVEGATKHYGGIKAVDGVDLAVAAGRILGVIGPNGAGKTTLFDLVSGYVRPDAGRVLLGGVDMTPLRPDARARRGLGRSFQDARLFSSLTVREVIAVAFDRHLTQRDPLSAIFATPDQRVEEALVRERVDELIDLAALGAFADKFVSELSTGSRRIVDLVCALAHDPSVLLLDEPSSGIAQREAESLGPLLRRISDLTGCALVVIEHDMPLITDLADELIAMDLGRIVARGSPETVVTHPEVVASYLGSDPSTIRRSGNLLRDAKPTQPLRRRA